MTSAARGSRRAAPTAAAPQRAAVHAVSSTGGSPDRAPGPPGSRAPAPGSAPPGRAPAPAPAASGALAGRDRRTRGNVYLVGFMGTGKTSVGQELARLLQRPFVDVDAEIVADAGRSIPEIFAAEGEGGFRERERRAVAALSLDRGRVVATGGGCLGDPDNLARLQASGTLVALWARPDVILERLGQAAPARPLLAVADPLPRIRELLAARADLYRRADVHLDTNVIDPPGLARLIVPLLDAERVPVAGYDVLVGTGLLPALGALLGPLGPGRRALVVADAAVASPCGQAVVEALRAAGFAAALATVPSGEDSKSLAHAERLYDAALDAGLDRQGWVVAVGGGVTGDLAGFVAATFLRGVRFVTVPTTLLAQVDAAVGGKVAVNLPRGKNLVGAFHQPRLVCADVGTLGTLPDAELRSGLAEVVKHGLLADPAYYRAVEAEAARLLGRDPEALAAAVAGSCRIKAAVVAADEREEKGVREHLNLGHTLAHAIEAVAGYGAWRHGEAVAAGLCAAGRLAVRHGLWSADEESGVERLLARLDLPTALGGLPSGALLAAMQVDKKTLAGRLRWILPERLGRVAIHDDVSHDEVLAVLRDLGAA